MADNRTPSQRSYIMSRIKSTNTKPEELVRKYLFSKGFRYRKNVKRLPGKPDIVLPKYRTVVFVNGCFWHKHDCSNFKWPKSNLDYWTPKIESNVKRDMEHYNSLSNEGWKVLIIWECELKKKNMEQNLEKLIKEIKTMSKQ